MIRKNKFKEEHKQSLADIVVSETEFLSMVEDFLTQGNVANMADLHDTYINVCFSNGVDPSTWLKSRKELKAFLEEKVPGVDFSIPRRKNESEHVFLKETKKYCY